MKKKTWIFDWMPDGIGMRGGNSVLAASKKEALVEIERRFGKTGPCSLETVDMKTLKAGTPAEIKAHNDRLDALWRMCN